jgi:hypothetical protein
VVGGAPHATESTAAQGCSLPGSEVDVAWIRLIVPEDNDTNRSRWATDLTWQVVQAAPFADAKPSARRLMRRHQRLFSVEHLDAGAYGYLVSRTAYLHPHGETLDVSRAARELVESLSKIAVWPDKEFGQLVRERRRQRGLPVQPAPSFLPDLPAPPTGQDAVSLAVVEYAAEVALQEGAPADELQAARVRLAERRVVEALLALEAASIGGMAPASVSGLEERYVQELTVYEQLCARTLSHLTDTSQ